MDIRYLFLLTLVVILTLVLNQRFVLRWIKGKCIQYDSYIRYKFRSYLLQFCEYWIPKLEYRKTILNWVMRPEEMAKLNDLAPSDNASQADSYIESLVWGVENPKVKNIALTGTYGSGKSSILNTFRLRNPQYHFLNISLANFRELGKVKKGKSEKGKPAEDNADEGSTIENIYGDESIEYYPAKAQRLIETSILQQIFYSVKGSAIPDSRFNRIKRLSKAVLCFRMVMLILTILSLVLLIKPALITELPWIAESAKKTAESARGSVGIAKGTDENSFDKTPIIFTCLVIIIMAIAMLAGYIFRNLNHLRFNKLNLVQGELEIERQSEVSILNNYLEELIYFFEATKFNVVILEDLDRFRSPEIFTKLRELNLLLNNAQQIGRRIVFIYAIKDDMFQDKTRTKFFDLIVPVIPVINSTNSLGILHRIINDTGLSGQIDEDLLSDITLYIDDMRVLKNIINEYSIYKKSLLDTQVNLNQLFSIIVYKNVYPKDFARLERRKGILFDVFDKVNKLHEKLIANNVTRINEIESEIESASQVRLNSLEELRAIYALAVIKKMPEFIAVEINGERILPGRFSEEDIFTKIITSPSIRYYYKTSSAYSENTSIHTISFKEIEKTVDAKKTYHDRANELLNIVNNHIESLKNQLVNLKKQNGEIQGKRLQDLIALDIDILDVYGGHIKNQNLLKYLVRRGYIDETYPLLISYFYEGDITMTDLQYIRKVKDGGIISPDYQLLKLPGIISKIKPVDLQTSRALNIFLIDYLLSGNSSNIEYLNAIARVFSEPNQESISFISIYFEKGTQVKIFVNKILSAWDNLCRDYIAIPELTDDQRSLYISMVIQYIPNERLIEMNIQDSLKQGIIKDFNLLSRVEDENISKIIQLLISLQARFPSISGEVNENILKQVSKYGLYDFSINNLFVLVKNEMGESFEESKFTNANFSYIIDNCTEAITERVNEHIEGYLTGVLLELPTQTDETEERILELLSNDKMDISLRVKLISKVGAVLEGITGLTDEVILKELLVSKRVVMNYNNLMHYFDQFGLNETLIGFINDFFGGLPDNISDDFWKNEEPFSVEFTTNILSSNEISNQAYRPFVNHIKENFNEPIENLPLDKLQEEKLVILIDNQLIEFNAENYSFLQKNRVPMHLWLAASYKEDFLSNLAEYSVSGQDVVYLLKRNDFTAGEKVKLVTLFVEEGNDFDFSSIDDVFGLLAAQPIAISIDLMMELDTQTFQLREGRLQLIDRQLDYQSVDKLLPFILKDPDFRSLDTPTKKKAILPGREPFISICMKLKLAGFLTKVEFEEKAIAVWKGKAR